MSAAHAVEAEVRLYDHLFTVAEPLNQGEGKDIVDFLNPNSLEVLKGCKLEPGLAHAALGQRYQFERQGYFCVDAIDSQPGAPVFNRTVSLRDTWAKMEKAGKTD